MDDTGHKRISLSYILIFIVTSFPGLVVSIVTAEEGRAATLQCPGFTPNPGGDQGAVFNWYKAGLGDWSSDNRVAFLLKRDGIINSERDLAGRATIDSTTGALQITQTRVSDDHIYTCNFVFTSMERVQNETQLAITVTPSEPDLQVTANSSGPVPEGESVTFNCSALRVRPPPTEMYWQFTDEPQHFGDYRYIKIRDGWTSSVSVQYSLTVSRNHHGRKLACHYVTSMRTIKSKEIAIQILAKPVGQPKLETESTTVEINSKVDLKCDSSQVEGGPTWFAWLANGTVLANTTQQTWTYATKEEATLQFVCIAGNWLGQSNKSEPLTITVQKSVSGTLNSGMITGITIGTIAGCAVIAIALFQYRKRRTAPPQPIADNQAVHYDEINPMDAVGNQTQDDRAIYRNERVLPPSLIQPSSGTEEQPMDRDSGYEVPVAAPAATYEPMRHEQARHSAANDYENQITVPVSAYEQLRTDGNPTYLELH